MSARGQHLVVTGYGDTFADCVKDAYLAAAQFFGDGMYARADIGGAYVHEEHVSQSAAGDYISRRTFAVAVTYRGT